MHSDSFGGTILCCGLSISSFAYMLYTTILSTIAASGCVCLNVFRVADILHRFAFGDNFS